MSAADVLAGAARYALLEGDCAAVLRARLRDADGPLVARAGGAP